jgi:hypothetical protein
MAVHGTLEIRRRRHRAGVAQSVERQPSKLNVAGSRPVSRSTLPFVLGTTLSLFGVKA